MANLRLSSIITVANRILTSIVQHFFRIVQTLISLLSFQTLNFGLSMQFVQATLIGFIRGSFGDMQIGEFTFVFKNLLICQPLTNCPIMEKYGQKFDKKLFSYKNLKSVSSSCLRRQASSN